MERIKTKALEILVTYGFRLFAAILILVIGISLVNIVIGRLDKTLDKREIDLSLHSFIKSFSSFISKVIVVIIAATIIGIPPTTFIAMLSAAGLAIGLALRDSLSNFAGGVLILIFRPFDVGDFIDAQGFMGTVKEIQLLYTSLNATDNTRITIPNGDLANGTIINYSVEDTRRLNLSIDVSFDDDIDKVKEVLGDVVKGHPLIFQDPEPLIRVKGYGEHAMEFAIRAFCKSSDYWEVYYDLHEEIKEVFERENITIPFNQLDVNISNDTSKTPNN